MAVDNYQGEESDIVVTSFTRGNPEHNIGFMSAPERLNVLLSRARDGLIMIGNGNTFRNPRTGPAGGAIWRNFFRLMDNAKVISDGLPVKCERHPTNFANLVTLEDFETYAPDGSCGRPWSVVVILSPSTFFLFLTVIIVVLPSSSVVTFVLLSVTSWWIIGRWYVRQPSRGCAPKDIRAAWRATRPRRT